MWCAEF
jgi:hypothetical protein